MIELFDLLNSLNCKYIENALLKNYLTFKVGGPCKAMVFPDNKETLAEILKFVSEHNIIFYIIGNGSNLLARDEGYNGIIINTSLLDNIRMDDGIIYCLSGTPLIKLCRFALDNSLSGIEFAYGIPGTVGGAVFMNAGAYGGEIKDIIIKSEHIDNSFKINEFSKEEIGLDYRFSNYSLNNFVITGAYFRLNHGNKDDIRTKMNDLMSKRKNKQPLEYPSAGSTFKRPEGHFAGALIEECGLKGFSVGGAKVSDKHAGFVVNSGNATCADILKLVEHCRTTVLNLTGVELEPEVRIIE